MIRRPCQNRHQKATKARSNKVEKEKSANLLAPNSLLILKYLVSWISDKTIPAEFELFWGFGDEAAIKNSKGEYIGIEGLPFRRLHFDSLVNAHALFASAVSHDQFNILHRCYITPLGYELARSTSNPSRESPVEREFPVEITDSLDHFRSDHPSAERSCFLMMRFGTTEPHERIAESISNTVAPYGITALRADAREYHSDIYTNILTYIYGCSFGIAVF